MACLRGGGYHLPMLDSRSVGALIGAFFGGLMRGLPGAVIGAILGAVLGRHYPGLMPRSRVAGRFIESTFAVMGAVCKADGQVSASEIDLAEALFERFKLSEEQRRVARIAFDRGKLKRFDLDAELFGLRALLRGNRGLRELFLQVQVAAVMADGQVHPAEAEMLQRIALGLDLSALDLARIEAMLRQLGGQQPGSGRRQEQAGARARQQRTGARTRPDPLTDAYLTLGLEPGASEAEVKKAYRRMMSRHHPDKLAAHGLPESMQEVARERTLAIRQAYDTLRQHSSG